MKFDLPMPPAALEPKTFDYLFQMAQQLNLALSTLDSGNFASGSAAAEILDGKPGEKTVESMDQQYQNVRSLIIKSADVVRKEMQQITANLKGIYVAQSEFGSYVEKLSAEIEVNPDAITQYYKFASELSANLSRVDTAFSDYKTETGGYIRTGIVYYDGTVPKYGVAVGQDITATVVDGKTVIDQTKFRSVFTAEELSFWDSDVRVAYISNQKINIPEMMIGSWSVTQGNGFRLKWIGG